MPTINTEVEFDVYCTVCSKNLDVEVKFQKGGNRVYVEPCDNCLEEAQILGHDNAMTEEGR